jgi:predicted metal-binding membrane protein
LSENLGDPAPPHSAQAKDSGKVAPERRAVWFAIAGVTVVAWLYLWRVAAEMEESMSGMADMVMPRAEPWGVVEIALTFAMWAVMMVGMMLPGAAPTIALFASLDRRRRSTGAASGSTIGAFGAGYLAVWAGFSVAATLTQWGLDSALLLTMAQASANTLFAGALLLTAGVYQLTPLKHACLTQCRSPLAFLMMHWRGGQVGAFRMGARHGAWCLGCCGALMLLLFVGGVMNLVWVAALAVVTMAEKLVPKGEWLTRGIGVILVMAAAWTVLWPLAN